jgi:hypothetical protein
MRDSGESLIEQGGDSFGRGRGAAAGTGRGGWLEQDVGGAWQLPEQGRSGRCLAASGGGGMAHACANGDRSQATLSGRFGNFGTIPAMDRGPNYQRIVI